MFDLTKLTYDHYRGLEEYAIIGKNPYQKGELIAINTIGEVTSRHEKYFDTDKVLALEKRLLDQDAARNETKVLLAQAKRKKEESERKKADEDQRVMKLIIIKTPTGEFALPLMKVAEHRAAHFCNSKESDQYELEVAFTLRDNFEGIDWLINSTWDDWRNEAKRINDHVHVTEKDFWTDSDDFELVEIGTEGNASIMEVAWDYDLFNLSKYFPKEAE